MTHKESKWRHPYAGTAFEIPEKWIRRYYKNNLVYEGLVEFCLETKTWFARWDGALIGKTISGYKTVDAAKEACDRAGGCLSDWKKKYDNLKKDYDEVVRRFMHVCYPEVCGKPCMGDPLKCTGFDKWR